MQKRRKARKMEFKFLFLCQGNSLKRNGFRLFLLSRHRCFPLFLLFQSFKTFFNFKNVLFRSGIHPKLQRGGCRSTSVMVYWPYPDGTDQNTPFFIVHYQGQNRSDEDALTNNYTMQLYSADSRSYRQPDDFQRSHRRGH